ncbi:MAG TPA: radical SAM family heme chaperone HemW [Bacteroidia bacterium]|jgi:oxygen-independent coproporphyrinogen-3 oxidase|nr:radical SAM family heme chaperone HemW [Bacteroidia bacterium]HMU18930.1 radical SAM family heme chaperone HemW [Bacteroidia bacterium]
MAGVYIHIPFCRKACTYCDFHFSTEIKNKSAFVEALLCEIVLQARYIDEPVTTIYFGGGTPSLLTGVEIDCIIEKLNIVFKLDVKEITLEANPDNLTTAYLKELQKTAVNRLSVGVQSFEEQRLQWMNRSHNAQQAVTAIENALQMGFNVSADLIFALPEMSTDEWQKQLQKMIGLRPQHISAYSLTLEERTVYHHQVAKKKIRELDDVISEQQFLLAHEQLSNAGYHHYEISNYASTGHVAIHNSSYWKREVYLGLGPSAHSFDGKTRKWNISNNTAYIKSVNKGVIPFESEVLTEADRYNEFVMTGLRTAIGINRKLWDELLPVMYKADLLTEMNALISQKFLVHDGSRIFIPFQHWYKADQLISKLFAMENR